MIIKNIIEHHSSTIWVTNIRTKAAVSGGGKYNLTSHYGILSKQGSSYGIGWSEGGQGRMRVSL